MLKLASAFVALVLGGLAHSASFQPGDARIDPRDVRVCGRDGCLASGNGIMNVMDRGAKCDGVTDDTAAFNAAFGAAVARAGGSTIRIPAGRCVVNATLALTITGNKSIRLQGDGRDVSEIVWSGNTDGIVVSLASVGFSYFRTPTASAPVFRIEGVSLVSAGSGIGGTALSITSNAVSNAASGGGLAPNAFVRDIAIHGTAASMQGWHDGINASNLPSGMTITNVYVNFTLNSAPWNNVGAGIKLRGGAPDANNNVQLITALYTLTDINVQQANKAIDIGPGLQDVNMTRVSGNGMWGVYADYGPWSLNDQGGGQTSSIRYTDGNPLGVYASLYFHNINYVWITNSQPQPWLVDGAYSTWKAIDFEADDVTDGSGGVHHGQTGVINISGNQIVGGANLGTKNGSWTGIKISKAHDDVAAYNQQIISNNHIAFVDQPIDLAGQTVNTLIQGNDMNSFTAVFPVTNVGRNSFGVNLVNGVMESFIPTTGMRWLGPTGGAGFDLDAGGSATFNGNILAGPGAATIFRAPNGTASGSIAGGSDGAVHIGGGGLVLNTNSGVVLKQGNGVCWGPVDGTGNITSTSLCAVQEVATGKFLVFSTSGRLFSIDPGGNVVAKGSVTTGSP